MSESPLVSIIIPAFNAAATISQSLESIRGQTYRTFEAIVVDDGSKDHTAEIIHGFCQTDERFRLVQQQNAGVSAARNAALDIARGELIAFLDADDVWLPSKLGRQVQVLGADPKVNFVFTNFFIWDGQRDLGVYYRDKIPHGDVSLQIYRSTLFLPSTVLMRRELLGDCRFDPQFCGGEDWDLWMRLVERGLYAGGIAEPLARYRRWEGNATTQRIKMTESAVRVLQKNFHVTRRTELRQRYQRSLNVMQGQLAIGRALLKQNETDSELVTALWQAWRLSPHRAQWLFFFLMVQWPVILGGSLIQRLVHNRLVKKFS